LLKLSGGYGVPEEQLGSVGGDPDPNPDPGSWI